MSIVYDRISELCNNAGITITDLERTCNLSISSIKKWDGSSVPRADSIQKIAQYFNVSSDYLVGRTNIKSTAEEILADKDLIALQRARENMSPQNKEKMIAILKTVFDEDFSD